MQAENQSGSRDAQKSANEQNIIAKYGFLKGKIILNYHKGCKILKIAKIAVAVLFVLFTITAVISSYRHGHQMGWLVTFLILIFFNIAIFVPADYAKYLVQSKVIPYLENDEQVEFGEYDIFAEDIDGDDEWDDEEEEE